MKNRSLVSRKVGQPDDGRLQMGSPRYLKQINHSQKSFKEVPVMILRLKNKINNAKIFYFYVNTVFPKIGLSE